MQKRLIQFMLLSVALMVAAAAASAQATGASQSNPSSSQSTQTSSTQGSDNQQTIEGCLVREEHALYLMPASGDKTQVSSSGDQDLNSHMGQEVRLRGSSSQGGSSSQSSTSSNPSSGSSTSSDNQFVVTKVDVVAHTCPADIQNRIDQDKAKNNSSK
ncbi:MAG TPA: hypothetical protein VFI72_12565 [Candidatus Angelobacter sp.]|jgi:hypothetical protein|nr:hypothetical protein [Candidatus Angelobacter sp.]